MKGFYTFSTQDKFIEKATTLGVRNRGVKKAPSKRINENIKVVDPFNK